MVHDVWVEVDLQALRHNLTQVRRVLADGVRIMAVVKANGYAHGYVEPSRAFFDAGADALAVTRLDEALAIREAGITAPVLLFAPIHPDNVPDALEADLELTITGLLLLQALSAAAVKLNKTAQVHIKVDTGMGRLGEPPAGVPALFQAISDLPSIDVKGIYTHFATAAESDTAASRKQLQTFLALLDELKRSQVNYGLAHAANSAAILRLPQSHLDMVRPGTILYGQYPSQHVPRTLDLRTTWRLKSRICQVRTLSAGASVGYGSDYVAKRETRAAVVPVGFADGFTLAPEGPIYRQSALKFVGKKMRRNVSIEVHGRRAPVLGRVGMQMTTIDVTGVDGVDVGDEVVVPALRIPTSALIPRVYVESFS